MDLQNPRLHLKGPRCALAKDPRNGPPERTSPCSTATPWACRTKYSPVGGAVLARYVICSIKTTVPEPILTTILPPQTHRKAAAEPRRLSRQLREEPVLLACPAVVEAALCAVLHSHAPKDTLQPPQPPRSNHALSHGHARFISRSSRWKGRRTVSARSWASLSAYPSSTGRP